MRSKAKWFGIGIALTLLLATTASAERRWFVAGDLEQVDPEASIVVIDDKTLTMTRGSLIKNADGNAGTWDDIAARDGEYVSVLVSAGHPYPMVETIVLDDEEEDPID